MRLKKKSLSLVDIAKHLNISPTTVSFIVNGKSKERRISDNLKEKVLKFVEEVGYKPNQLARSFRTGKTNIIGLMVEDIANPFFANLARLIEEKAYNNGYKILYCSTENDPNKAKELILMFRDRHIDGYIITPTEGIKNEINQLINTGAPVILFDRNFDKEKNDYVVLNNFDSSFNAVKHLFEQGYREIGFITINSLQSQMQERLHGYEKAIDFFGLKHYVKEIGYNLDTQNTVEHILDFLKRKPSLDALFFSTNYLGISGLKAIKLSNKIIPESIGVISFDDHIIFELHTPTITAIAQPIELMADQIINILLDKLASQNSIQHQVVLAGTLHERESTAKKNK